MAHIIVITYFQITVKQNNHEDIVHFKLALTKNVIFIDNNHLHDKLR